MSFTIVGCSSVPSLPLHTVSLSTEALGKQYYYCESCNIPTELSTQLYKSLEPDVVIMPITKPFKSDKIINRFLHKRKERHKSKIKKHKHYKLKHKTSAKQCIQWSQ